MENLEPKYAELEKFLSEEVFPDMLIENLTDLREQFLSITITALFDENKCQEHISSNIVGQLHYFKRAIEILSNIKNN